MVKLSRYEGNVSANPNIQMGGRVNPNIIKKNTMGDSLMKAGSTILEMERLEKEADRFATVSERTKNGVLELDNLQTEAKEQENPEQYYNDRIDIVKEKVYGDIEDTEVRKRMDDVFNGINTKNTLGIRTHQRQKVIDRGVAALQDTYDAMKGRFSEPMPDLEKQSSYELMDTQIDTAYQSGFISAKEAQKKKEMFRSDADFNQARRQIIDDPHQALKGLKAGEYPDLDPEKRLTLMDKAQTRIDIQKGKLSGVAREQANDIKAQVLHTGDTKGFDEAFVALEAATDTATANAFKKDVDLIKQGYDAFSEALKLKPSEALKKIEELEPEAGSDNFADAYKVYDTAQKQYAKYVKELSKDPAGTVAKLQDLSDPRDIFEAQKMVGVPEHRLSWFSEKQAKEIVAGFEANDSVETMLQDLNKMFEADGEHFKYMFRDLVEAGLDQNAIVLMNMNANPAFNQTAIKAFGVGQKELEKRFKEQSQGAAILKTTKASIHQSLEDFRVSFIGGTMNRGFSASTDAKWNAYQSIEDAITTTALYSVVVDGQTPSKAIEQSAKAFAGQYAFNNGYRVPREYDIDRVDTYADFMTQNLQDLNIVVGRGDMDSPEEKDRYIKSIKENGIWVTNDDEDGLILLNNIRQPVFQNMDGAMKRVEFKFEKAELDYPEIKGKVKGWFSGGN